MPDYIFRHTFPPPYVILPFVYETVTQLKSNQSHKNAPRPLSEPYHNQRKKKEKKNQILPLSTARPVPIFIHHFLSLPFPPHQPARFVTSTPSATTPVPASSRTRPAAPGASSASSPATATATATSAATTTTTTVTTEVEFDPLEWLFHPALAPETQFLPLVRSQLPRLEDGLHVVDGPQLGDPMLDIGSRRVIIVGLERIFSVEHRHRRCGMVFFGVCHRREIEMGERWRGCSRHGTGFIQGCHGKMKCLPLPA